jgi:hypothetical protein
MWFANTRIEHAELVINLRDGGDGRTGVVGATLLVNRDCGRKATDLVHIGLLHLAKELTRIGRERLHILALPFGKDCIEGERRLARTGKTRDNSHFVARQLDRHVLEVVRSGTFDDDFVASFFVVFG